LCHNNIDVPEEKISETAKKLSVPYDTLCSLLEEFEDQIGACQDIIASKDEIIFYSNGEPYLLTEKAQKALFA
jgi:hypothetical protein